MDSLKIAVCTDKVCNSLVEERKYYKIKIEIKEVNSIKTNIKKVGLPTKNKYR